jgi:hypothetical protein
VFEYHEDDDVIWGGVQRRSRSFPMGGSGSTRTGRENRSRARVLVRSKSPSSVGARATPPIPRESALNHGVLSEFRGARQPFDLLNLDSCVFRRMVWNVIRLDAADQALQRVDPDVPVAVSKFGKR